MRVRRVCVCIYVCACACVCVCVLTQRRLQHAAVLLTVADGVDLRGVRQAPEVVLVVGAVEAEAEPRPRQPHHRGDAGGGGVAGVQGLQLHARLELIQRGAGALRGGERTAFIPEDSA